MKRDFWLCGLLVLLGAAPTWALSARKIGPVEVGFVESDRFTVSPDGLYLAVLSTPGEKGSDCTVIERATHKHWDVPGSSRMEPLAFARDGHALWVWGLHGDEPLAGAPNVRVGAAFIALYDPAKRRYRFALSGDVEDWDVPSECRLSADGRTLIYSSQDGWVRGFSTRTGRQKWKKRAIDKGNVPVNVTLSPDGARALRFPDDEGKFQTTQIISTRTGRVLRTLKLSSRGGMMSAFQGGRFAPRGRMVAVFKSDDQSWNFFDGRSGRWKWKMGAPSRTSENSLTWVWSPDASRIAVSGPQGFELRDARDGRVLNATANRTLPSPLFFFPDALVFSPDGTLIYALAGNDWGFGAATELWQWRVEGTRAQRRADAHWLSKTRAAEREFALSPARLGQSLIQAARGGDPKRAALLLDRGADVNTVDAHWNTTVLGDAVDANDVYAGPHRYDETARLLLKRGADVKAGGGSLLASAAAKGDDDLVRLLLARGIPVNADSSGYGTATALHAATNFGKTSTVRLLLVAGANVNAADEEGVTPLLELAGSNSTDGHDVAIAQMLLDAGAALETKTASREVVLVGETALGRAVNWNKVELSKFLLERGADPNARNDMGETPLITLAQDDKTWAESADAVAFHLRERLEIGRALLKHGADARATNKKGESALDLAVSPAFKALLRSAPSAAR